MEPRKHRILDLFSGTGSATQAFRDRADCLVLDVDIDPQREPTYKCDIEAFYRSKLNKFQPGDFDFIWASPPCKYFSIANQHLSKHWWRSHPYSPQVFDALKNVAYTLHIIEYLQPQYWALENPRGMLRTVRMMDAYPRRTVTYCQYGHDAMKPTDLWGRLPPTWQPLVCENGDDCHYNAKSSDASATELKKYDERIHVPYGLSLSIAKALDEVKWQSIPLTTLFDFESDTRQVGGKAHE